MENNKQNDNDKKDAIYMAREIDKKGQLLESVEDVLNKVNQGQTAFGMCELARRLGDKLTEDHIGAFLDKLGKYQPVDEMIQLATTLGSKLTEDHIGAFLGKLGENQDIKNMTKLATTLGNKLGSSFETFLKHCQPQELTIINISKILPAITDGNKSNVNLSVDYVKQWCNEDPNDEIKQAHAKGKVKDEIKQAHAEGIVKLAKAVKKSLTNTHVEAFIKYFEHNTQNSIDLGLGRELNGQVTNKQANRYFEEKGQQARNVARTMALCYKFFSQAGVSLKLESLLDKAVEFGKGLIASGTHELLTLFVDNNIKLTSKHADIVSKQLADDQSTATDIKELFELFNKANVKFNVDNLLDKVTNNNSGAKSIKELLDTCLSLEKLQLEQEHVVILLNKLKFTTNDIKELLKLFGEKGLLKQEHVVIVLQKLVDNKSKAEDIKAVLELFCQKNLLTQEHVGIILQKLVDNKSKAEDIKAVLQLFYEKELLKQEHVGIVLQKLDDNKYTTQEIKAVLELFWQKKLLTQEHDVGIVLQKLVDNKYTAKNINALLQLFDENGSKLEQGHFEIALNKLSDKMSTAMDIWALLQLFDKKGLLEQEHVEIALNKLSDKMSTADGIDALLEFFWQKNLLQQEHVGIVLQKLDDNKYTANNINALLKLFYKKELLKQEHVGIVLNKLVNNESTAKDINALLELFEKKGLKLERRHVSTLLEKLKDDQSEEDIKQLGNMLVKIVVGGLVEAQSYSLSDKIKISSSTNRVNVNDELQRLAEGQSGDKMVELAKKLGCQLTVYHIGAFLNKLETDQSIDNMVELAKELGYRLTGDHVKDFLNKLAEGPNISDLANLIKTLGNTLTKEHIEILVSKLETDQDKFNVINLIKILGNRLTDNCVKILLNSVEKEGQLWCMKTSAEVLGDSLTEKHVKVFLDCITENKVSLSAKYSNDILLLTANGNKLMTDHVKDFLDHLEPDQDGNKLAELAKALGNKLTTDCVTILLEKCFAWSLYHVKNLLQVFFQTGDLKLTEEQICILLKKLKDGSSIDHVLTGFPILVQIIEKSKLEKQFDYGDILLNILNTNIGSEDANKLLLSLLQCGKNVSENTKKRLPDLLKCSTEESNKKWDSFRSTLEKAGFKLKPEHIKTLLKKTGSLRWKGFGDWRLSTHREVNEVEELLSTLALIFKEMDQESGWKNDCIDISLRKIEITRDLENIEELFPSLREIFENTKPSPQLISHYVDILIGRIAKNREVNRKELKKEWLKQLSNEHNEISQNEQNKDENEDKNDVNEIINNSSDIEKEQNKINNNNKEKEPDNKNLINNNSALNNNNKEPKEKKDNNNINNNNENSNYNEEEKDVIEINKNNNENKLSNMHNQTEIIDNDSESLIDDNNNEINNNNNNNEKIELINDENDLNNLIDTGNDKKINNDNNAKFQGLFDLLGPKDYNKYFVDENNEILKLENEEDKELFKNTLVEQLRKRLEDLAKAYENKNETWQSFEGKLNVEKEFWGEIGTELATTKLLDKSTTDEFNNKIKAIDDLNGFVTALQWLGCVLGSVVMLGTLLIWKQVRSRIFHPEIARKYYCLQDNNKLLNKISPLQKIKGNNIGIGRG